MTLNGEDVEVSWSLTGEHNVRNACAAMLAARHVGVKPTIAAEALGQVQSVKRRMELLATVGEGHVYDDFAHHPTAIETTLAGLVNREHGSGRRVIAVIEPRSNTMKMGIHQDHLIDSARAADQVYWFEPTAMDWPLKELAGRAGHQWFGNDEQLLQALANDWQPGDQLVFMSNGGFHGVPHRFAAHISQQVEK